MTSCIITTLGDLQQALANMTYDGRMEFARYIAEWCSRWEGEEAEITPSAAAIAEMLTEFYAPPLMKVDVVEWEGLKDDEAATGGD